MNKIIRKTLARAKSGFAIKISRIDNATIIGIATLSAAILLPLIICLLEESADGFGIDRQVVMEKILRLPAYILWLVLALAYVVTRTILLSATDAADNEAKRTAWPAGVIPIAIIINIALSTVVATFQSISWFGDAEYYALLPGYQTIVDTDEDYTVEEQRLSYRDRTRLGYLKTTKGLASRKAWSSFFAEEKLDAATMRIALKYYFRNTFPENNYNVGVSPDVIGSNLQNIYNIGKDDPATAAIVANEFVGSLAENQNRCAYWYTAGAGSKLVSIIKENESDKYGVWTGQLEGRIQKISQKAKGGDEAANIEIARLKYVYHEAGYSSSFDAIIEE